MLSSRKKTGFRINIQQFRSVTNIFWELKLLNHLNPKIFTSRFQSIARQYPTCFVKKNFYEPNKKFFKSTISSRAPLL